MEKQQRINQYCKQFNLSGIALYFEQSLLESQQQQVSYTDYLLKLFEKEANVREQKSTQRRLKLAKLPINHDLNLYDFSVDNGLTKTKVNQLRELHWLDQIYNIIFMGPSGTGKTFMAAGICFQAVKSGYKAYFRTIEQIVNMLKMKEYTRSAAADYNRLIKAQLIVIDDIMLFPLEKTIAVSLFNFVNQLFEKTAFVITTNKAPKEWVKMLDDEVLATALLDRLLYRCEVINLSGKSYRMINRKTIFN